MKVIYSGLEGSGKSLRLAMRAEELLIRNHKWALKSGIFRKIASNLYFSEEFMLKASLWGIEIVYYKTLEELILLEDCDVIIDEVGTYFDARGWESLTLDVRMWLTQGSKCGVDIYGSAQDFAQVDLAFRRLVNELYFITKLIGSPRPSATRPPIKHIWGICLIKEIEPLGYDEATSKFKSKDIIPNFFLISKSDCAIFDTRQKITKSPPMPFKHILRSCQECSFSHVSHK